MKYTNIAIDCIGFLLMFILFCNGSLKKQHKSFDQRLFHRIIFNVMIMFLIDGLSWVFDQETFNGAILVSNIVNVFLYMIGPITTVLWLSYVDFKIFDDIRGLRNRIVIYSLPVIVNTVLSLIQLITPILFRFDPNNSNCYIRLPLSWYTYALPLLYIAYSTILLLNNKKKISKKIFIPLILYMVFPLLGTVVQMLGTNLSTIYIGTALSIIIVYVRIQNDVGLIDDLTGLQNRRHLIEYLNERIVHNKNENLYILMIDIDDFKSINDTYGHSAGDRALVYVSEIFLESVKLEDFVSRYAGDEFIIVLELNETENVEKVIDVIQANLDLFNTYTEEEFRLQVSCGYTKFIENDTTEEILKRADAEMYKIKKQKQKRI